MNEIRVQDSNVVILAKAQDSMKEMKGDDDAAMSREENSVNEIVQDNHAVISGVQTLKKFELAQRLRPIIQEIDHEKNISYSKMICLTCRYLIEEACEKPWTTTAKCALLTLSISNFVPVGIGSYACLNSFRVGGNLSDLDSSDTAIASNAVSIYSNTGQGITFFYQNFEYAVIPAGVWIFENGYNKVICRKIAAIYSRKIQQHPRLSDEEIAFLINRANKELVRRGGLPIGTCDIDLIQQKIDAEENEMLSIRKIICLTGCKVAEDIKKASMAKIAWTFTKSIASSALTTACLIPLSVGTYACYASFNAIPVTDLISEDRDSNLLATGTYSNLGHVVEYVAIGGFLAAMTARIAGLKNKYNEIYRQGVTKIYTRFIEDPSLSKEQSDLLYKRLQVKLGHFPP